MANFTPVDHDPFGSSFTPVDHDPFADDQRDAAHKQARAWLDAHPEAQHGFANNMLAQGVQGATLGWGDEMRAGLAAARDYVKHPGSKSIKEYYNLEKAMQDEQLKDAQKNTGVFGTAAEIGGSFLPGGLISKGVGAAAKLSPGARAAAGGSLEALPAPANTLPAVVGGAGVPAIAGAAPEAAQAARAAATGLNPLAAAATEGAIAGGIQGAGDGNNATYGAALGGIGGVAGYGLGRVLEKGARAANTSPAVEQAMSASDIKNMAQREFNKFTNSGGHYTPQMLSDLKATLGQSLMDNSWSVKVAPKVKAVIDEIDKIKQWGQTPGGGVATPKMLQNVRGLIGSVRKSADPEERRFGHILMGQFDNFISNPQPQHYVGGNGQEAAQSLMNGNKLWAQYSKADALETALGRAERRAASTYAGGNAENAMRQEVRRLYEKRPNGWTPEEMTAINRVIYGDSLQNNARRVGKMLAPEGIKGLMHVAAAVPTGGATLPLAALGYGAKHYGEKAAANSIEELSRVVRAGGVKYSKSKDRSRLEEALSLLSPMLAAPGGAGMANGLLGGYGDQQPY